MNSRELATLLNLSQTTVSLALKNHPRISEATKLRVREAAAKYNYQPNAMVSALMARIKQGKSAPTRGEVLGFLTALYDDHSWKGMTNLVDCFEGASARANQHGFIVEPFWLGYRGQQSTHVARVLRTRAIRGSLFVSGTKDMVPVKLDWANHLVVSVGYTFAQQPLHMISHNHTDGALTCYAKLREAGYKRIALMLHEYETNSNFRDAHNYWCAGFLHAPRLHGGEAVDIRLTPDYDDDPGFAEWFRRVRPDAIIGIPNHPGLKGLRSMGIDVPNEVGYASLDVLSANLGQHAGIQQDWRGLGATMVDVLVGQISANEHGLPAVPKIVLIDGRWRDGKTVRSPLPR